MGNEKDKVDFSEVVDGQVELGVVRARLVEHVRIKKGLPNPATQLEVKALSKLTDAQVIDDPLIETGAGILSAPIAKDSPVQIAEVRIQKRVATLTDDLEGLNELRKAA